MRLGHKKKKKKIIACSLQIYQYRFIVDTYDSKKNKPNDLCILHTYRRHKL